MAIPTNSTSPPIVSRQDWLAARAALLQEEKTLTQASDRLAAARRRLPRELVEGAYRFVTSSGTATLPDLFDGRSQLIIYHHMLKAADPAPCAGCSMFADGLPNLAHLHARDATLAMVSTAPLAEIEAFKARLGWSVPWHETTDSFSADFGVAEGFGINVFLREGDQIFRTYFTSGRGVEGLGSVWSLLDLTPRGRQETWEESPPGTPQSEPYQWWRLNDEYSTA